VSAASPHTPAQSDAKINGRRIARKRRRCFSRSSRSTTGKPLQCVESQHKAIQVIGHDDRVEGPLVSTSSRSPPIPRQLKIWLQRVTAEQFRLPASERCRFRRSFESSRLPFRLRGQTNEMSRKSHPSQVESSIPEGRFSSSKHFPS